MPVTLAAHREALSRRWRSVRRTTPGHRVGVPVVAVALAGAVLAVAALTRPLTGHLPASTAARWGWSADLVARGEWWRLGSAVPLTRDAFMLASTLASLLVAVGTLERLAGRTRAAVTAVSGAVAGFAAVTAVVVGLRAAGWEPATRWAATLDYGASAGVAACAGAVAGLLRSPPVTGLLAAVVAGGLVAHHQIADWEHAASFLAAHLASRPPAARERP